MNYSCKHAAVLTTCIAALLCACTHPIRNKKSEDANPRATFRDPADFIGVFFKPGLPSSDQGTALNALASPIDEAALRSDLELLKQAPAQIPMRVVGHTDTHECSADDCMRLSLRRAEFIHRWLIANGIPETRLDPPKGYGAARPIGDNLSESGRARNRRAYIAYESETTD
ncbi:OmpA family protein [Lysobacter enzymogenes]|uniref:OmpA family protein n=1 Tax=Lysobacter enzymogenes TaxID=69 RepID=UPI00384E2EA5